MTTKQDDLLMNWTEVGGPNSGIVRQKSTGIEAERRLLVLDHQYDPTIEQLIYKKRKETKLPLVSVYGAEQLSSLTTGKDKEKKQKDQQTHLAVVTESVPFRLADAPQLTYKESLYVLDRSLEGFENAYENCGPMRVNDRLIGFNNQGACKVWVNEDLSNNHPSYPKPKLATTRGNSNRLNLDSNEADMVQDIVNTVENYSEQGRFPQPFATQIHKRNLNFVEARKITRSAINECKGQKIERIDLVTNKVKLFSKTTRVIKQNLSVQTPVGLSTRRSASNSYRFNYLPPNVDHKPQIFASRAIYEDDLTGHPFVY